MSVKTLGFWGQEGINIKQDHAAISEMIRRVLTTRRGERVGNLSYGSDVSKYIFMPEMSLDDLISEVKNSIIRNIPGIRVLNVTLESFENDSVKITVDIQILETGETISTDVNLVS